MEIKNNEDVKKTLNQQLALLIKWSETSTSVEEIVELNEQILRNLNFLSNLTS